MTAFLPAMSPRRRRTTLQLGLVLAAALLAALIASLSFGVASASITELIPALLGNADEETSFVLTRLRLPRAITGALVGGALGLAGAYFQSMVRNPLASPDVIGLTAAASAAAVLAIAFLDAPAPLVSTAAVVGAGLGALLTYGLSYQRGQTSTVRIVLVGIGVAAGCAALTSYALTRANIINVAEAQAWLAGSLNGADWSDVVIMTATTGCAAPLAALAGGGFGRSSWATIWPICSAPARNARARRSC